MSNSLNKDNLNEELDKSLNSGSASKITRFVLACLSGVIPIAGGAIGGAASAWSEAEQTRFNQILASWLKLQEDEIKEIGITMVEIMNRLDHTDPEIQTRLESPEYLSLVKKAFRDWSAAESEEKRVLVRNLLSNAAATKICSDDVIRMFLDWIDKYAELHFKIIRLVYKNPDGITRFEMWQQIHGERVREDSAEADLFKLVIHELTTGHVIRQERPTDYHGNFLKQKPARSTARSTTVKSAFDDEKEYELTKLGGWFVSYTMNEIVPRLNEASNTNS